MGFSEIAATHAIPFTAGIVTPGLVHLIGIWRGPVPFSALFGATLHLTAPVHVTSLCAISAMWNQFARSGPGR